MGLMEKLFGKKEQPAAVKAQHTFQLLDGYTPAFHTWNGSIFESDLIRAALDAHGRHAAKLQVNIQGSAKQNLQNRLKIHMMDAAQQIETGTSAHPRKKLVKLSKNAHVDGVAAILDAMCMRANHWAEMGRRLMNAG